MKVKTKPDIQIGIDQYNKNITQGKAISQDYINDKTKKNEKYRALAKKTRDDNFKKNRTYIEEQIRLNNLKEINNSKQITIYILYFILLISGGFLVYLLR